VNDLRSIFDNNKDGKLIHKWEHYFDVYHRHLSRFRGKQVTMLEIGVSQGGSLDMWREYFGDGLALYAVDIDERCKQFEREGVTIFIGDQGDRGFLRKIREQMPPLDILIDDGGHTMKQQIRTFEELYGHVKTDGVFICEDLCTSYMRRYGGGIRKKSSFIEYSKNFIDQINAWFSENKSKLDVSEFSRSTDSLHYYSGMLVIEKGDIEPPRTLKSGVMQFDSEPSLIRKVLNRIRV